MPRAVAPTLRRLWRWLWAARTVPVVANGRCPVCQRPVVTNDDRTSPGLFSGPMFAPRTRQELQAACLEHGRPPFNDLTKSMRSE